jgi:hypothetical protein
MAAATNRVNWGRVLQQGIVAAVVGGITFTAFGYFAFFLPNHGTIGQLFALDARNVHQTSPWIGALAHACVCLVWGIAFAYIANTRPSVNNNPWIAGIVYGFIVWLAMQLVLLTGNVWQQVPPIGVVFEVISHTLFFGVPIALTVRALSKTA